MIISSVDAVMMIELFLPEVENVNIFELVVRRFLVCKVDDSVLDDVA